MIKINTGLHFSETFKDKLLLHAWLFGKPKTNRHVFDFLVYINLIIFIADDLKIDQAMRVFSMIVEFLEWFPHACWG